MLNFIIILCGTGAVTNIWQKLICPVFPLSPSVADGCPRGHKWCKCLYYELKLTAMAEIFGNKERSYGINEELSFYFGILDGLIFREFILWSYCLFPYAFYLILTKECLRFLSHTICCARCVTQHTSLLMRAFGTGRMCGERPIKCRIRPQKIRNANNDHNGCLPYLQIPNLLPGTVALPERRQVIYRNKVVWPGAPLGFSRTAPFEIDVTVKCYINFRNAARWFDPGEALKVIANQKGPPPLPHVFVEDYLAPVFQKHKGVMSCSLQKKNKRGLIFSHWIIGMRWGTTPFHVFDSCKVFLFSSLINIHVDLLLTQPAVEYFIKSLK